MFKRKSFRNFWFLDEQGDDEVDDVEDGGEFIWVSVKVEIVHEGIDHQQEEEEAAQTT